MSAPKTETRPKIGLMDLSAMRDDPRNARTHSGDQVELLAGLILKYGWTNPNLIDVSAESLIVAGHGRKRAAQLLADRGETIRLPGGQPLPKGKIPFIDVSGWSEDDRRSYALADNQSALRADWDAEILTAELDSLANIGIDADSLGFTDDWLERLTADADPGDATRGMGPLVDSEFVHEDQYGVIVMCPDAKEQQAVFERLRDEGLNVKVVVV